MKKKLFFVLVFCASLYAKEWPIDCVDLYSMPLIYKPVDFYSGSNVFLAGDVITRATKFNHNRIKQTTRNGEKWICWEFNNKTADYNPYVNFNYEGNMKDRGFPFESLHSAYKYSLTVLNDSPLSMKVQDANSMVYTLTAGEKKQIVFDSAELRLLITEIEKNHDYKLLLKDLTIYYHAAQASAEIKAPAASRAKKEIDIQLSMTGKHVQSGKVFDLEMRGGEWVIWRIRLNAEEIRKLKENGKCGFTRTVPWYLPAGKFTLGAVIDHRRVEKENVCVVSIENKKTSLPVMSRQVYNGVPTVFMNGQPFTWSGFATYYFEPGCVNQFGYSNVNVFFITTDAGRHVHHVAAPTWYGDSEFDFGSIQESVCMALAANPDAKLVFRVSLLLPPSWLQNHPDSMARIRTDDGLDVVWEETNSTAISIASEDWRRQQKKCLEKLIRFCMDQPWSKNVISFFPSGEVTEEWFAWGCNEGHFADYSPLNQRAFAQWCKKKEYPFSGLPNPKLRKNSSEIFFPDTYEGKWAAAYNEFYNDLNSETIEYYAKIIKNETKGRSLVGALFGYEVQLAGEPRQSTSGQFNLKRLLDSPYIDYVSGIPLLDYRHLTKDGYDTSVTARSSIIAAGKLYDNENDQFSWLHNAHWYTEYDPADPRGGCISMHRRVNAGNCIYGSPQQWFELFPTWHSDRQLHEEFAIENKIHNESIKYNRTNLEECAFVIDEDSFIWKSPDSLFWAFTHKFLLRAAGLTGAPIDVWLLSDIDRLPEHIKFVIVADASAAKTENIIKLKKIIEEGRRTLLIIGLPGFIDRETNTRNLQTVCDITGFDIKLQNSKDGRIKLASNDEFLADLNGAWNPKKLDSHNIAPRACVENNNFIVYTDGTGAGDQRLLKNGGRLIWSATPPYMDQFLLREWMENAGVHFYSPIKTFVRASEELVAFTSVYETDMEIPLMWPHQVKIEDMFDGWAGEGKEILCPFKAGQTRLFRVNNIRDQQRNTK